MNRLPHFPKHTIATMFLCLLAFCTTGCVRSLNPFATPAMVVNSEYYTETDRLPDELKRYLPYAVDYYTPDNDLNKYHAPKNFSNVVFNALSLNFLWTGARHEQPLNNASTYAAMPSTGQTATLDQTEMAIINEFSKETFTLLAILDWDNTGTPDWLVLYTYSSHMQPETSKRLLLVRDILPNKLLAATVLSAEECFGNNCQTYSGKELVEFLDYEPQY
ncbi:MAG: hypothetical protein MI749_03050 [Desulfovibrionales bacterium]|nr:hypothetical protein [Desulfovibrionales bacterium]